MNHDRRYELAISLFAFSYFADPAAALRVAYDKLHPGGLSNP